MKERYTSIDELIEDAEKEGFCTEYGDNIKDKLKQVNTLLFNDMKAYGFPDKTIIHVMRCLVNDSPPNFKYRLALERFGVIKEWHIPVENVNIDWLLELDSKRSVRGLRNYFNRNIKKLNPNYKPIREDKRREAELDF